MDKLEPHQAFLFDGNASHSWNVCLKHFHFYLDATEKEGWKWGGHGTIKLLKIDFNGL